MRKTIIPLVMLFLGMGIAVSGAQTPGPATAPPTRLETDEQKTFYALGLLLGDNVKVFDLKPEDLAIVKAGMTDAVTGVNASSTSGLTSDFFDVTDTLCVPGQLERCEWKGGTNDGITAHSDPPTAGANLGIGFNSNSSSPPRANFTCNGGSSGLLGGAVVNINPRGFTAPFDVDLTYKKSLSGNGPASGFVFCDSHDGIDWGTTPTPACTSPLTDTPCIKTQKRVTGGDLLIVLTVRQDDPWGGIKPT